MDRYIGFGSDKFAGVPIVLTNPVAGNLATQLAALPNLPKAGAYRVLSAGSVTITDTSGRTATWTHAAGEGYALPVADVVAASNTVLVFF